MTQLAQAEIAEDQATKGNSPIPLEQVSKSTQKEQETTVHYVTVLINEAATSDAIQAAAQEVIDAFRQLLENIYTEKVATQVFLYHTLLGSSKPDEIKYWDFPGDLSIVTFARRFQTTIKGTRKIGPEGNPHTLKAMMIDDYLERITPK